MSSFQNRDSWKQRVAGEGAMTETVKVRNRPDTARRLSNPKLKNGPEEELLDLGRKNG